MRFDHAVIGVADLGRAVEAYQALGFVVRPGGRHTGEGTHNAIIRFGLDYLELMAVHDPALARSRPFGSQLLDFLERQPGGLIGYVVAGGELDALAETMRRSGLEPTGPLAMQRELADGHVLSWRLLFPSGPRWHHIAPFVVEWITSDADRVSWDAPVPHPNGVTGVSGLAVAVPDLARATTLYAGAFGLATAPSGPGRVRAALGDVSVDLVAGGEGVLELTLGVRDMAQAAKAIPGLTRDPDGLRSRIPLQSGLGARLVLAPVSGRAS